MAKPLVVLLPALGLDSAMYAPLARLLEDRADVRALDYPDHAFDDLDPLANYFVDQIKALGVQPTILGGLSLGGTLAFMAASSIRPSALLLIAPGGLRVANARREAIHAAMEETTAIDFVHRSLGISEKGDIEASRFRDHFGTKVTPEVRAYYEHLQQAWPKTPPHGDAKHRAEVYAANLRLAVSVDQEAGLAANETPADVVWGEDDRVFSARTRTRYVATLKASELHLLPNVGHFAPLEAPDAIARIVKRRLDLTGL